ncbi:MAG: hypothetical protein JWP27_2572 [Flaviaesturariibacter sp.]|nr:hypothetical protein [Flaviaesturariibacter sp.]
MYKIGALMLLVCLAACRDKKTAQPRQEEGQAFDFSTFTDRFQKAAAPYQLTDTGLLALRDTASIRQPAFLAFLGDSATTALFGSAKVKYTPLAHIAGTGGSHYFVVRGASATRQAALLLVFNRDGAFGGVLPFLLPDANPATSQSSLLDKAFSVTRNTVRREPDGSSLEGKDVFVYNADAKNFTLIMTDGLDEGSALINPIDTLGRKQPFSGDYGKEPNNLVSIRDASNPKQINFFIHFEKENDCTGELKGTALLTSSRTAVFRQGGDPCNVEFTFSGSSVTIREVEGCGSHRGVKCVFEGRFPKKKEAKAAHGTASAK